MQAFVTEEDGMESIAHRFLSAAIKVCEEASLLSSQSISHIMFSITSEKKLTLSFFFFFWWAFLSTLCCLYVVSYFSDHVHIKLHLVMFCASLIEI